MDFSWLQLENRLAIPLQTQQKNQQGPRNVCASVSPSLRCVHYARCSKSPIPGIRLNPAVYPAILSPQTIFSYNLKPASRKVFLAEFQFLSRANYKRLGVKQAPGSLSPLITFLSFYY